MTGLEFSRNLVIDGKEIEIVRLLLREWTRLEEAKLQIKEAIEEKNLDKLSDAIVSYVCISVSPDVDWKSLPWTDVYKAFVEGYQVNAPTLKFPILTSKPNKQPEKYAWEYDGRGWYFWASIFAKSFGWDLSYIAKLDVDDAIGLFQEILISQQLDKEWDYSLSELAYPYDQQTKTSSFKPMERPMWMKKLPAPVQKFMIPKWILPVGNVIGNPDDDKKGTTITD